MERKKIKEKKRGGTNHSNTMVLVVLIITKLLEEKKLEIIFHLIVDLLQYAWNNVFKYK